MKTLRLPDLNKVQITGRLTRNPELRKTSTGKPVVALNIAYNHRFKDREGIWKDDANFFRVTAWGRLGELRNEYLSKGSAVMIEGRLTTETWENKEG
jgi:single-strand DNA-binding protein